MSLYALLNSNGKAIAYHHSKRVIQQYLEDLHRSDCIVVRVKRSKRIELEDSQEFAELYLMRTGGGYVPNYLYDSANILMEEELYDYETVLSIIERDLISEELDKRTRQALERTYLYFKERRDIIKKEKPDMQAIRHFSDLRDEYLMKTE